MNRLTDNKLEAIKAFYSNAGGDVDAQKTLEKQQHSFFKKPKYNELVPEDCITDFDQYVDYLLNIIQTQGRQILLMMLAEAPETMLERVYRSPDFATS